MIPAAQIRERYFQADIGFDEPRDLHQFLPEFAIGIARAIGRRVAALLDRLQQLYCFESLPSGSIEDLVAGAAVHLLKRDGSSRIPHLKIVDAVDSYSIVGATQGAGNLGAQANCANGRFRSPGGQRAVEPAIAGRLRSRSARLHVVLRVEMRARRIGGAGRVDDGQMAGVIERLERLQRWMQAEKSVEI